MVKLILTGLIAFALLAQSNAQLRFTRISRYRFRRLLPLGRTVLPTSLTSN